MSNQYFKAKSGLTPPISVDNRFIMEVDSTIQSQNVDPQFDFVTDIDEFQILTDLDLTYNYDIQTEDGYTATNITGDHTIKFPSGSGIHRVYISGTFPKCKYLRGDTRLDSIKILKIYNWGIYGKNHTDQNNAFRYCRNLSEIADDVQYINNTTNGYYMFYNHIMSSLPIGFNLLSLTNGVRMFQAIALVGVDVLTSLPDGFELPLLVDGRYMFVGNNIGEFPTSMTGLSSLVDGDGMFNNNNIQTIPYGFGFPELVEARGMFEGNRISRLRNETFPKLKIARVMFNDNDMTSLGDIECPLLERAEFMFQGNLLGSLPNTLKLINLIDGKSMFAYNDITMVGNQLTFNSLTDGIDIFLNNTLDTSEYSNLLINIEANNPNYSITFNGGNSKYNSSGEVARNALINRNWVISDGGLEI